MLRSKVVFISVNEGSFTTKDNEEIKFYRANFELEGGHLVKDIKFDKGALDGLNRFDEVMGYFEYREKSGKCELVFTGYKR